MSTNTTDTAYHAGETVTLNTDSDYDGRLPVYAGTEMTVVSARPYHKFIGDPDWYVDVAWTYEDADCRTAVDLEDCYPIAMLTRT